MSWSRALPGKLLDRHRPILYDQAKMRRFVSIAFILLCWLGPLSALLPGSDGSQLPACCRRHGAHHCAMATAADQISGADHVVSAPARCPQYHRSLPATTGVYATPRTSLIAEADESQCIIPATQPASLDQTRTTTNRGPPALL